MATCPTARSVVVCEEVAPDVLNPNRLSLHRVIHSIRPVGDSSYPLLQHQLCVFAQLTEARGTGRMWVEVRHADTDEVTFRTRIREVTFPGNDPLRVHGVHFRILRLPFLTAGLYWIQLWFNDDLLTQTPVVLRP